MARKNASPNQIIRKDGKGCFVEALKGAFEIGKVQLKFVTYDSTKQSGNKITNEVDIYMDFAVFNRIAYDILDSKNLVKQLFADKAYAEQETARTGQKVWTKQTTIYQGGSSVASLAKQGKQRADGKAVARILKIFAGDKLPIMFRAESGPGESDAKGLIVPRYGTKPEQYVQIGMSTEDVKEFFTEIRNAVSAYLCAQYVENNETIQRLETEITSIKEVVIAIANTMGIPAANIISQQEAKRKQEIQEAKYGNNYKPNNKQPDYQPTDYQPQNQQPPIDLPPYTPYDYNIPPDYGFQT